MERKKQTIWKYGQVQMPLKIGYPAWYCEDGFWKTTGRVLNVVEEGLDHVTFETERYRYCFEYQKAESAVMALAA